MRTGRQTDGNLSPLTLGTVQLGSVYGIANVTGQPSREKAANILAAAVAGGITSFDTAHAYGESEEILGEFISRQLHGNSLAVTTKLPAWTADELLIMSDPRRTVREAVTDSLTRLRLQSIPICLLHDPAHLQACGGAVLEGLATLRAEGLVSKTGLSVYSPEEAMAALKHSLIEVIQIPFNLFDQRWAKSGILKECRSRGVTLMARSVFLQGLLLMADDDVPEELEEALPFKKKLTQLAAKLGRGLPELALQYALSRPEIDTVLIGVDNVSQLTDNLALAEAAPLDIHDIRMIEDSLTEVPEHIVNPALWPVAEGDG